LFQEGETVFAQAIDALRPRQAEQPDEERQAALGLALGLQAHFSTYSGHADRGWELVQESLSILRTLGARREVAYGYGVACYCIHIDTAEAKQLLQESLEISKELDYYPAMAQALWLLSAIALREGAYRVAEQYSREALNVSRDTGSRHDTAFALAMLGHSAYGLGEYARARQCYEESLAFFQEVGLTWAIGRLHQHLGDVVLVVGDYEGARDHHRRALACYQDVGAHWVEEPPAWGGCWCVPVSLQTLADIALVTGDRKEAREYYRQALELAMDRLYAGLKLHVLLGPARLLAQEGNAERAAELAALALHHPASVEETRVKAKALLNELRVELSPDVFLAAEGRGRARDLDATLAELTGDMV
jgi:tetratricopeptide (TPR) repeat protein